MTAPEEAARDEAVPERVAAGPAAPEQVPGPAARGERIVAVLAAAQVLGGVGFSSGIVVNGKLAQDLSGSTSMAGVAQTMSVIGTAALAVPLARLAQSRGRRPALSTGYAIGAVGAFLSLLSGTVRSFPLLLAGALLYGGGSASGLQARFAAIDGVDAARRGRTLSLVVWGTTVGVVTGPLLTGLSGRVAASAGLPRIVGPFLFALVGFTLGGMVVWLLLRPDPLAGRTAHALRAAGSAGSADGAAPARLGTLAALAVVRRSPDAVLALAALGVAHAVMVAVMVMTPVHMFDAGARDFLVGAVISSHTAGMYALSPVMGVVVDRFGRRAGIGLGVTLLTAACLLAASSPAHSHVTLGVALALLGLGWSASVVSGSTLLSESVPVEVRTSAQGLSDLTMGAVATCAGVVAGPVVELFGYGFLATGAVALLVPVVGLLARPGNRVEPVGGPA